MLKNIILQLLYQISLYLCIVKQKERGFKTKNQTSPTNFWRQPKVNNKTDKDND